MFGKPLIYYLSAALLLLLLIAGATVLAQSSAGFKIEGYTTSNGGGLSQSASYHVNGTIGQSPFGSPGPTSTSYQVSSGYWIVDDGKVIHIPSVLNNSP